MRVGFNTKRIFFFLLNPLSISPSCTVLNTFYPLIHVGYGLYRPFYTSLGTSQEKNGGPLWQRHQISSNECDAEGRSILKGTISKSFFTTRFTVRHCLQTKTNCIISHSSSTSALRFHFVWMTKKNSLEMQGQCSSLLLIQQLLCQWPLFLKR